MILRFALLFLAMLLDRVVGDPPRLWARYPHPVVLFGKAVSRADKKLNDQALSPKRLRARGVLAIVLLLLLSAAVGLLFEAAISGLWIIGLVIEVVIIAVLLAQKSLSDHVLAVADGLNSDGLAGGRRAVSMIVGRDPETLDEPAVCRAAIESLAENFSDGVTAPAFWYLLAGLPGLFAYKMLNTADSMIGHKNERYLYFGWASARLDDLANSIPARFSAFVIALGAWAAEGREAMARALSVALADHGHHRSPNSGWPEAAMAGAIDLQLAGPRVYGGVLVDEPMLNRPGRQFAEASDIRRAVLVFNHACSWLAIMACAMSVLLLG